MIRIEIPGQPIPLKRPRFSTARGFVQTYDSQKSEKNLISKEMLSQRREIPAGSLSVSLLFYFKPAISDTQTNLKLWGIDQSCAKDLDNLIKFYLDCGNEILWKDDRQICSIKAFRRFSNNPCTVIFIEEVDYFLHEAKMDVFKLFSPEEMEEFISDAQNLPCFNKDWIESFTMNDKKSLIDRISLDVTTFSSKWSEKLKKLGKKNARQIVRF